MVVIDCLHTHLITASMTDGEHYWSSFSSLRSSIFCFTNFVVINQELEIVFCQHFVDESSHDHLHLWAHFHSRIPINIVAAIPHRRWGEGSEKEKRHP